MSDVHVTVDTSPIPVGVSVTPPNPTGVSVVSWFTLYPSNATLPIISGDAGVGIALNTTTGSWTNYPNSYGYQWENSFDQSTWAPIDGATSSTYTIQNSDLGLYLRAVVSAQNIIGIGTIATAATSQVTRTTLLSNLDAHYSLGADGSGNVYLGDATGHGNTLANSTGVTLGTGIVGGCATFTNSNYLVSTTNLTSSYPLTYSAWFKSGAIGTGAPWGELGTGYPGFFRILFIGGDAYWQTPDGNVVTTTDLTLNDGNWHHVVGVADGTTASLYVDGDLLQSSASNSNSTTHPLEIGGDPGFNGWDSSFIEFVDVWSRALSGSEVFALYNAGTPLRFSSYGTTI